MTFSELKEKAISLPRIDLKLAFIDRVLSQITVANRVISFDGDFATEDRLEGLKWSSELMNGIHGIRFELAQQVDNQAMERLFREIVFYMGKSDLLKESLPSALVHSMQYLNQTETSWEYELDIDPKSRFLQIWDRVPFGERPIRSTLSRNKYSQLSDADFNGLNNEYQAFQSDWKAGKLLSLGIGYAYANIQLPKVFEIVFDLKDTSRFWKTKTIVRYALNYRDLFHTDLWRGHSSHVFLEVPGEMPDVFSELPQNGEPTATNRGIGLCTAYDWQFIREREK